MNEVLPFVNEQKLYDEYRLDEPWNGPHNRLLLDRRPEIFQCITAKGMIPKNHTTYLAVVGAETVWPGTESIRIGDISDGTSNTVLVLEVRDAEIPWLAPDDLTFEEGCTAPSENKGRRPSSFHTGGLHVLFGDGRVPFVNSNIAPEIWRALWTRNGGEKIEDF